MAQLYGKQLAKQIPSTTSGNQARLMFGAMTKSLNDAYAVLDDYASNGVVSTLLVPEYALAKWAITSDSVSAARAYLDSTNNMLQGYYADMFEDDAQLTDQLLLELQTAVSTSSVAVKTIDDLFTSSFLAELCDAIIEACGTVTAAVANAVSKVAGSFIGGTWWIWLVVAAVLVFWSRYKRGEL